MTQIPSSPSVTPPPPLPPRSNALGLAGFVVSLVGFLGFCVPFAGLLSLVGLILSAIAVRREPRGFAIAGLILGALGSVWMLVTILFLGGLAALLGAAGVAAAVAGGTIADVNAANQVVQAALVYHQAHGAPPASIDALVADGRLPAVPADHHGVKLYLRTTPTGAEVLGCGDDRTQGTADDKVISSYSYTDDSLPKPASPEPAPHERPEPPAPAGPAPGAV